MRKGSRDRLLMLGFDTDLITKLDAKQLTISSIRGMNRRALLNMEFTEDETNLILEKSNREAIPGSILADVLKKSGEVCCYCSDGNNSRPIQIHHIEEYHKTRNNEVSNLMLVCPTHHVSIHKNKISKEDQSLKKSSWENIWAIAKIYQNKGISFPFGAFERIDYSSKGNVIEIFSFASPKGSVCKQLLQETIISETRQILEKENKIILSGESGSGKTTLAKGIAGFFDNYTVFTYIPGSNSNEAVKEVLIFLSTSVKPILLILDDANARLGNEYIEKILLAAKTDKKIIVITTNNKFSDEGNIEQHFLKSVYPITWNLLKGGVRKFLLDHEHEVIQYLTDNGLNNGPGFPIGSGHADKKLSIVVDGFMENVKTVWQFIFLLSSGNDRIDRIQTKLYSHERMDLIVLFIGINQIAKTESGTRLEDLLELYIHHSSLNKKPAPDIIWLKEQVNKLINERIVKEERGRYNTIHRRFARNVIEHSYFKVRKDTKEILDPIFSNARRIEEIVILWAWLSNTVARDYIQEWYKSLDLNKWNELITEAGNKSLKIICLLADQIYSVSLNGYRPCKGGFEDKAKVIASLISKNEEYTLHYLEKLFLLLNRDYPGVTKEIMNNVELSLVTNMVRNTEPELFSSLEWLFTSLVRVYPEWVEKFSLTITSNDFLKVVDKIEKGDIDTLYSVVNFQRTYIENIRFSQYKIYLQKFADLLKGCSLEDIRFFSPYTGFHEISMYPDELFFILQSLDGKKLANDFSKCMPRHWGNLISVSLLSRYIKTDIISKIIDDIDIPSLKTNISCFSDQYHFDFRVLIYQLCYGSISKREEFSMMLRPFVKSILQQSAANDVMDVLKAYYTLNPIAGQELCDELGKPKPDNIVSDDIFSIDFQESEQSMPGPLKEYKEQIEKMEKAGEDYFLEKIKFSVEKRPL